MKKLQIGVMGAWRKYLPESSYKMAEEIGAEIARRKCVLVTGGTTGIGESARKGNEKEGGTNISMVPQSKDSYKHLGKFLDLIISSGSNEEGRISIMINSCDAIIVVGGSSGTLMEVLGAYLMGKAIVIVEGAGLTAKNIKKIVDDENYLDDKKLVKVHFAKDAKEAVDLAIENVGKGKHVWEIPPVE